MRTKTNRTMSRWMPPLMPVKPSKARAVTIEDKTTAPIAPAVELAWLVARVEPRREVAAADSLAAAGHVVWYPRLIVWISSARLRKKIKVNRPLFPGYLLVAKKPSATKAILDCDHVRGLIAAGTKWLWLSQVIELYSRELAGEFDLSKPPPPPEPFAEGETVEINEGAGAGIRAVVWRSDGDRVSVLMDMLGAKRVITLRAADLARVS